MELNNLSISGNFSPGFADSPAIVGEYGSGSLASTFRGRNTAMSGEELRKARESRAADALKMKDEQLKILSEQNASLLKTLDKLEEEANTIQLEKLAVEQENRSVRDSNFELQSKARAAETLSKRMQTEVADKEKQLRIMTDQNSELLRLLESEESLNGQLQSDVAELRSELDELRQKHSALLTTAKTHEELATKAAKEGQLRAEEIRLLRVETEQLKQQNTELKMKTQVEVESLQEQLRVRKEKQYQLLEKLQSQEEAKRQAEDHVAGMEEQLRGLHAKNIDLETQIKVESRAKFNFEETNKDLQIENGNLLNQNKDLQSKIEKSEKERIRMEAEARDSGEKLREMAEKLFSLLERLKLSELGKTKAMDALKKKEQDMVSLQKKNARLIKESTDESKSRVQAELDIKVLQDQVRVLKKNNNTLAQKSKEEVDLKVKSMEQCEQLQEKLKTMESRLSFLLNKVQADEEMRVIQIEDRKKLEAQVLSYTEKCDELQHKLTEMGESNRIISQAMRFKQEELTELTNKYETLVKEKNMNDNLNRANEVTEDMTGARPGGPDDIDNVRLNEGRGRFYVEAKSVGGGSLLLLKARKPLYKEWLEKLGANDFLKKAQKTTRFRDLIVEKIGNIYGLLMVEEEEKAKIQEDLTSRDTQLEHIQKKLAYVQDNLAVEEDAKRRMLLRYIHAVKEHAMALNEGTGGVLQLPESNITDEEIHALAALLRNNTSIEELNLRSNMITDDGARALGAVLAGKSGLKLVDLRGNKIGKGAIHILAEALRRSERVRHVYVHAGGKIEALGAGRWANPRDGGPMKSAAEIAAETKGVNGTVETVCVVDIRDNNPENTSFPYELNKIDQPFQPITLLDTNNKIPGKDQLLHSNTSPSKKHKKIVLNKNTKSIKQNGENNGYSSEIDKKKTKLKDHEEKLLSLREASWNGRSAGLDIDKTSDLDVNMRESIRIRKKNLQRGELPPLSESSNNLHEGRTSQSPVRNSHSAPDLNIGTLEATFSDEEPEAIMVTAATVSDLLKTKSAKEKKKKPRKTSDLEKRLQNSPFSQPLIKNEES
eukprot:gene9467-12754_t